MRILLWHGYLLGGTGSNVYTRALAREWSRAGHEVVVLSQEPHPEQYDLGGARHVRPEIGGLLPVFVLDRYEGLEARLLPDLTREERERYVELNAAAEQDVVREHDVGRQLFADRRGVQGDVAVAFGGSEVRQHPRLDAFVAVEHEHRQQAADVGPDDRGAAELVELRVRLLTEDDDLVAGGAPFAGERTRVDVRARAAEEVAVPEQDPHGRRL